MSINNSSNHKEQILLVKAIDTAFFWNMIGNYLGWGSLLSLITSLIIISLIQQMQIGILSTLFPLIPPICILLFLTLLPIAVPVILILNLVVILIMLRVKLKHGILPRFNKPKTYFIKGIMSSILFFIGSALFIYTYCNFILFSSGLGSID